MFPPSGLAAEFKQGAAAPLCPIATRCCDLTCVCSASAFLAASVPSCDWRARAGRVCHEETPILYQRNDAFKHLEDLCLKKERKKATQKTKPNSHPRQRSWRGRGDRGGRWCRSCIMLLCRFLWLWRQLTRGVCVWLVKKTELKDGRKFGKICKMFSIFFLRPFQSVSRSKMPVFESRL